MYMAIYSEKELWRNVSTNYWRSLSPKPIIRGMHNPALLVPPASFFGQFKVRGYKMI